MSDKKEARLTQLQKEVNRESLHIVNIHFPTHVI